MILLNCDTPLSNDIVTLDPTNGERREPVAATVLQRNQTAIALPVDDEKCFYHKNDPGHLCLWS